MGLEEGRPNVGRDVHDRVGLLTSSSFLRQRFDKFPLCWVSNVAGEVRGGGATLESRIGY